MNTLRHALFAATTLSLAGISPLAQAAPDEGWDWIVAPYGWVAGVSADLETPPGVPPVGGISTDTRFDDVVDKLDGAFQIHIEGQGNRFGVFTDFTFLGLSDQRSHPRFELDTDVDTRLFELAAVWSPDEGRFHGLDLFAGLRYLDTDVSVKFHPLNPAFSDSRFDGGESFSDFMLGGRYTWNLSDRWGLTVRGDGSFGETDGTWNASAVANYKMKKGAWFFGYRYLGMEFESGGYNLDFSLHGPQIGYGFKF